MTTTNSKDQDEIERLFREFRLATAQRETEHLHGPIVLAGAGKVGTQLLGGLHRAGVEVVAFTDNDARKWGRELQGIPIISPAAAGRRFGSVARVIVAIGNLGARWPAERTRLQQFGARSVMHFPAALKHWPELQPLFFLQPSYYSTAAPDAVRAAFDLFEDSDSRSHFLDQLRWRMLLDEQALPSPSVDDQYFPDGLFDVEEDDVLVDVGAFDGDTLAKCLHVVCEGFGRYHAFEPDPTNIERLSSFVSELHSDLRAKITIHRSALSDANGELKFAATGTMDARASSADGTITVRSERLDDLLGAEAVSILKIDVEGFERQVLSGAVKTLTSRRPIIALAVYHSAQDLHELPLWIARLLSDYRFFLRSHGDVGIDTVLYAIPAERRSPKSASRALKARA